MNNPQDNPLGFLPEMLQKALGINLQDVIKPPEKAVAPIDQVKAIEKELTDGEMNIVNYHRNTVATGTQGKDEEGRPVTVFSSTIQIPEGEHKGKYVTVPGYFDGKVHTDEGEIYSKWKNTIKGGKWQVYENPQVADKRAKFLHTIMDLESN